jgi:hypothetical protein
MVSIVIDRVAGEVMAIFDGDTGGAFALMAVALARIS